MCIYIYIYVYDPSMACGTACISCDARCAERRISRHCTDTTVSFHSLNLLISKFRVSNPRTVTDVHFKMPCESSNLPGAGPIFPRLNF